MAGKFNKYKLVDYFDVWGNSEDGYEVNNLCTIEDEIIISENITDDEILEYLSKTIGWLSEEAVKDGKITIVSQDDYMIEIESTEGYPLGRLEKIN